MGRRSRKRALGTRSVRGERDAARRERATGERPREEGIPCPRLDRTVAAQRPPALWAPFPLTEIIVLGGIGLMLWGLLSGGDEANSRIAAGLAIASIGGLEVAVREHVNGFRSHTTLLAAAAGILAIVALGLGAGVKVLGILLIIGTLVSVGSWFGLRELFKRRSGGFGFR